MIYIEQTNCNALRMLLRNIDCCGIGIPGTYFKLLAVKFETDRVGVLGIDVVITPISSPFCILH